jgi:hypothetical protein
MKMGRLRSFKEIWLSKQAGSARVWRIGNFQLGFAAGNKNFKRFEWRRKWRI